MYVHNITKLLITLNFSVEQSNHWRQKKNLINIELLLYDLGPI